MIDEVTPEVVDMVVRAIRDPMIGGWPLIHWEWVFSTDWLLGPDERHCRGVLVMGAYPEEPDRSVTLRYHPQSSVQDHPLLEQ